MVENRAPRDARKRACLVFVSVKRKRKTTPTFSRQGLFYAYNRTAKLRPLRHCHQYCDTAYLAAGGSQGLLGLRLSKVDQGTERMPGTVRGVHGEAMREFGKTE